MNVKNAGFFHNDRAPLMILFFILACTLFIRFDLSYNSLYIDESGYSFVGKYLVDGGSWSTKSYIFSSDLPLYALGLADTLLPGLGGRVLSAVFGVASLVLFFMALRVVGCKREEALLGVSMIAVQASHVIVSKMATYDSFCLFFISGVVFFLCAGVVRGSLSNIMFAGVFMAAAVLSKYIAIAYIPVFGFFLFHVKKSYMFLFSLISIAIVVVYVAQNWTGLLMLYENQIRGTHGVNSSVVEILTIIRDNLLLFFAAIFCLFLTNKESLKDKLLWAALLSAIPMLAYHLISQNMISLYKHMVFPAIFLSLSILILLKNIKSKKVFWGAGFFVLILGALNSHWLLKDFEVAWPNTEEGISFIDTKDNKNIQVLSEDPYLVRNAFYKNIPIQNIYDTSWFDPEGTGSHQKDRLIQYVQSGEFDYIYLNKMVTPHLSDYLIDEVLKGRYVPIYHETPDISSTVNRIPDPVSVLYKKV